MGVRDALDPRAYLLRLAGVQLQCYTVLSVVRAALFDAMVSKCKTERVYSSKTAHLEVFTPGGTLYNGLYGEAPPERGAFFRYYVPFKK